MIMLHERGNEEDKIDGEFKEIIQSRKRPRLCEFTKGPNTNGFRIFTLHLREQYPITTTARYDASVYFLSFHSVCLFDIINITF